MTSFIRNSCFCFLPPLSALRCIISQICLAFSVVIWPWPYTCWAQQFLTSQKCEAASAFEKVLFLDPHVHHLSAMGASAMPSFLRHFYCSLFWILCFYIYTLCFPHFSGKTNFADLKYSGPKTWHQAALFENQRPVPSSQVPKTMTVAMFHRSGLCGLLGSREVQRSAPLASISVIDVDT